MKKAQTMSRRSHFILSDRSTRFFFNKQHFYWRRLAEIGKNQAKIRQHPEAELLLFENCSLFSSLLSFKKNRRYS